MDPPNHISSSISSLHQTPPHRSRTLSLNPDARFASGSTRTEAMTRRGYSDRDVFGLPPSPSHRPPMERGPASRDGWMDSPGHPHESVEDARERMSLAAKRTSIMMEDRRRRLSGYLDGSPGRRSSSNLSLDSSSNHRHNHAMLNPNERPTFESSSSPANPFPPRIIDRPLPQRPSEERIQHRRSREIVLPKWQSDNDISQCPICGSAFNFWYRKHHCRKCGRVVCANCSPHRITIPRQFIVHPPDEVSSSPIAYDHEVVDLTEDDDAGEATSTSGRPQSSDYRIDPALGGGQEVRLCNPCVPDPNPLPHVSYFPPQQSLGSRDRMSPGHHNLVSGSFGSGNDSPMDTSRRTSPGRQSLHGIHLHGTSEASSSSRRHSHASRLSTSAVAPPHLATIFGSAPDQSAHQRYLESLLERHHPTHQPHRHHASTGTVPNYRYRPLPDPGPPSPPQSQRPQLREEDECPICHGPLPPKGVDGSETAREAHVSACIESHFSSSASRASQPPASAAIAAAVSATAARPSQASGSRTIPLGHRTSAASQDASFSFQQRRRTTGMVVYLATEKDCVGEDGEGEAECVICFEEFAVGNEMGRLECLCKFHKTCIRQWWDTKGPGACPVHQQSV